MPIHESETKLEINGLNSSGIIVNSKELCTGPITFIKIVLKKYNAEKKYKPIEDKFYENGMESRIRAAITWKVTIVLKEPILHARKGTRSINIAIANVVMEKM